MRDPAPLALRAFVALGAALLFTLEPLCGRLLVARFGGAFYVWTSALMFFQAALVLGYLYAHRGAPRLGRWHGALLLVGAALLPPSAGRGAAGDGALEVVIALGLPIAALSALLSATSVTAQRASLDRLDARGVYALYALSNVGSLGGLALDALVIAPNLGLRAQTRLWSALYLAFALLGALALRGLPPTPVTGLVAPGWRALLGWGSLSALTAAALSAVTNQLTLDAGQVPLLWALPLALYLGTFVVAFRRDDRLAPALRPLAPQLVALALWLSVGGDAGSPWLQSALHLASFALITLAAHGALYAARPSAEGLGSYYLAVAFGGALGGAFVALAAPALFSGLWELPLSLLGVLLAMGALHRAELFSWLRAAPRRDLAVRLALPSFVLLRLLLGVGASSDVRTVAAARSPYGVYHVLERREGGALLRELVSGTTRHGRQRAGDPQPLSYYHRAGSLGDAVSALPARGSRVLGVVGLGVGAAAAYSRPGDRVVFFELDPTVTRLARAHFRYLRDARGAVEVREGDARRSLAASEARFDLLLIDAFSGDAVPTHLITREAVALAMRRVRREGILLFHISNRFYDLAPVLAAIARAEGLAMRFNERLRGLSEGEDPSRYAAFARDERRLEGLASRGWRAPSSLPRIAPWTDDHADPLGLWLRGVTARSWRAPAPSR